MERIDVYDGERRRTGRVIDRGERRTLARGEHFLIVHACIFNSEGKMLIQRRSDEKKAYPGRWDVSAGGFARSGEDSRAAVLRETREELGLSLSGEELQYAFLAELEYVYDDFYYVRMDLVPEELRLQREELSEVRWGGEAEILEMIGSGEFIDYDPGILADMFCFAGKMTQDDN